MSEKQSFMISTNTDFSGETIRNYNVLERGMRTIYSSREKAVL